MKRLKRLFLLAFCLPLGILGAAVPDDPDDSKKQAPPDGTPPDGGDGGNDSLPKTQEELDALIEKRLARERKRLAKQSAAPPAAPAQPPAEGTQQPPAQAPAAPMEDPEKISIQRELLLAKAQISAIQEGIDPSVSEDAVYLALREAEKADEADEEGIRDALKAVLKRHPEWKKDSKEGSGGFRFGADGAGSEPATGKKKALPAGRVIF